MPDITMPRLSDTMEEGVLVTWRKKIGDPIVSGDVLVEVETDKAIMELEAFDDGVLERILVEEGERVPIGTPIGVIGDGSGVTGAGSADDTPPTAHAVSSTSAPPAVAAGEPESATTLAAPSGAAALDAEAPGARPPASPLARRIARERGVDLATVTGTGPNGRIIRADIEAADAGAAAEATPASGPPAPVAPAPVTDRSATAAAALGDFVEVPLTTMQRIAAARLTKSKQEAPHFYLTSAVDITDLVAFRRTLNADLAAAGGPKVSMNDLVVKAVATALRANPTVNVSFAGDTLRHHRRINVGVAVAAPGGLLVPVVRDADRKSLSEIAAESRGLSARARAGNLRPDEMSGGTFTVSNLGMFGVEHFSAVINPPEAAILAVGAATEEVRPRDGEMVIRSILRITVSCDHRAVDGATGATFLKGLTALLENPLRIVV